MDRYLIIDGNNMCFRVHWTHRQLSYDGLPVSVLYGFFRSLIALAKQYGGHNFVIAWDSKSTRRINEADSGVEEGLIPSGYKAHRDTVSEDIVMIQDQLGELKNALDMVRVFQAVKEGYEADDIIHTYAKMNQEAGGKTLIVTSDKDFFQILGDRIEMFDALKKQLWTRERFVEEYGVDPELWVDVGAIAGDTSDNIHGVEGWGEKTALKYVKKYGTVDQITDALIAKKKRGKKEQKLLDSKDRLALALSLKKMDIVPDLPKPWYAGDYNKDMIHNWMAERRFSSLLDDAWRLC